METFGACFVKRILTVIPNRKVCQRHLNTRTYGSSNYFHQLNKSLPAASFRSDSSLCATVAGNEILLVHRRRIFILDEIVQRNSIYRAFYLAPGKHLYNFCATMFRRWQRILYRRERHTFGRSVAWILFIRGSTSE